MLCDLEARAFARTNNRFDVLCTVDGIQHCGHTSRIRTALALHAHRILHLETKDALCTGYVVRINLFYYIWVRAMRSVPLHQAPVHHHAHSKGYNGDTTLWGFPVHWFLSTDSIVHLPFCLGELFCAGCSLVQGQLILTFANVETVNLWLSSVGDLRS